MDPAGFPLHLQNQTVNPIRPAELFYSDPTMSCGTRIWNNLTGIRVFSCSQLNAPPPVMSACVAPPNHPDPFRSGPHPIRDLGRPTWRVQSGHPEAQPHRAVVQLTPEEDQAITNLLKLHHQEAPASGAAGHPDHSGPAESSPGCLPPSSSEEDHRAACVDARYPAKLKLRRRWFEAALLSGSAQQDDDSVKRPHMTAVCEPRLRQSAGTPEECPALPAFGTSDAENGHVWSEKAERGGNTAPRRPMKSRKRRRSVGRNLSDLEEDAVFVLLSLGDAGT
ncbi:uncharacterized protein LOC112449778 [Kryptolebias marmoratus]|uniref:uncharacterized protein LOC112449778 n=1 Tax=Kryptolebias marmoratus TaxID=37003 RepID=UPI0018AC9BD2|nr:uncharacterized protein LOC112449778 [Kryptolebias marmoratus]